MRKVIVKELDCEGRIVGRQSVNASTSDVAGQLVPTVPLIRAPRIYFAPSIENQVWNIVVSAPGEVGWLGSVERRGNDLLIDGIYCFDQVGDDSFHSLDAEALRLFWREKALTGQDELLGRMLFWGHSHGKYPVLPSPTDRHTMHQVFSRQGFPLMIMGIFNHQHEAWFSVYDYENGVIYDDLKLGHEHRPCVRSSLTGRKLQFYG